MPYYFWGQLYQTDIFNFTIKKTITINWEIKTIQERSIQLTVCMNCIFYVF